MEPFSFGENWLEYSRLIDESRIAEAEDSLRQLLGQEHLHGLSIIDVGSGSALFAIAAVRLGAARVVAIDRDPKSVSAGRRNAARFLNEEMRGRLDLRAGDILDRGLNLGQYDVVYAWGSLHHTGAMWSAIERAATLCNDGGRCVLAIYNRTWLSPLWLRIKRAYNGSPSPIRFLMVSVLAGSRSLARLVQFKSPFNTARGMSVWYDAVDWLGGIPYECATPTEVIDFMSSHGNRLLTSVITTRSGCNEFVFMRRT